MGVLNDLWRGNITPQERHIKQDDNNLRERILTAGRSFRETLSAEQRELYEAYESLLLERRSAEDEETFIDAFRLGARMMLDVIGGEGV